MSAYKVIVALIALFMLMKGWSRYRERSLTVWMFTIWSGFWVVAAGLSFWPQVTDPVTRFIGIGRGVDLVFFVTILALVSLCFTLYMRTERLRHDLTRLTRELALRDLRDRAPYGEPPDTPPLNARK